MYFNHRVIALCLTVLGITLALPVYAAVLSESEKKRFVYEMSENYREKFPDVAAITPQEVMDHHAAGTKIIFIDTRRTEEIKVSTLPGAITKTHYLTSAEQYKDYLKVAYCTISYRSGLFSEEMATKGTKVFNLTGGILAWTLEGGQVFQNDQPVKQVHVFAERWNYAPNDYEVETFSLLEQLF